MDKNRLKEQLIEYLSAYEDGFKNRTAIRYLYKRNEQLWNMIVERTSFLPPDAKPKQRCWHILKEFYGIPRCPVDNVPLKWMESKYAEFSSHSAVARCVEKTKEKMETYKKKTGYDSWNGKCNPDGYKKFKETWLRNWSKENSNEKGDSND